MKGIDNNFESNLEPNSNVEIFGTTDDNYKYFNSLLHNIEKMENVTPLLQTSALIVLYLKEKTSFFDWILLQPKIDEKNLNNLVNKIGGLLTKHTAQLMCNSSIILHWDTFHSLNENSLLQENIKDSSEIFDFYHSKPVASGIYPSISMMNHSCKPNISLYFLEDVAIAKAATNINIGEEIFNCYGVDYKSLNKKERQDMLNSCYYFTCSCEICLFKDKEYDNVFNYNICKNCKEKLILVGSKLKCGTCKISFQKSRIRELENNIHTLLQSESTIEGLQAITDKASQFFGQNHELLYNCYEKMFDGCLKQGDTEKSSVYKRKCLQILLKSHGEYSRKFLLMQNALDNLNSGENYLHLYYPIKEISILRKITPKCDFRITNQNFSSVFLQQQNGEFVELLDFTGVYWIPKEKLFQAVYFYKSLKEVNLTATKLTQLTYGDLMKLCTTKIVKFSYLRGKLSKDMTSKFVKMVRGADNSECICLDSGLLHARIGSLHRYGLELDGITSENEEQYFYDGEAHLWNFIPDVTESLLARRLDCANRISVDYKIIGENIGTLKRLKKLTMEIPVGFPSAILENIFKECKNLKFIKLLCLNPSFQLSHLEYAKNLEHLSFYSPKGDFMLEKFLLDVVSNKMRLKRISLSFKNCVQIQKIIMENFLKENPQLIFFCIQCELPTTVMKVIQNDFKKYTTTDPQKRYLIKKRIKTLNDFVAMYDIPIIHFDMIYYLWAN